MAFENLRQVDFTGEVTSQLTDLFRTDAVALCDIATDLLEVGPQGVAKAAASKISTAVGTTVSSITQSVANELNYSLQYQFHIDDFQINLGFKIDLAEQFLNLVEGGKIIGPEGIDIEKMKNIIKNLDPTDMKNKVAATLNRDKINAIASNTKQAFFNAKQTIASTAAAFTANGGANAKKMISLQGICTAAAVGPFDLGLKSAIAIYLNGEIPDLSLGEIHFLTNILI